MCSLSAAAMMTMFAGATIVWFSPVPFHLFKYVYIFAKREGLRQQWVNDTRVLYSWVLYVSVIV